MMSLVWDVIGRFQYAFSRQDNGKRPTWRMIRCRFTLHKCGVVWFNTGNEPDMHCKYCDEDLG